VDAITAVTAHQVLTIVNWFQIGILLVLLLLIGRLYQRVSGRQTWYWAFAIPTGLFGVASARYAFTDQLGGDTLADAFWGIGGLILVASCVFLSGRMIARR
jgi:hypothetical protein